VVRAGTNPCARPCCRWRACAGQELLQPHPHQAAASRLSGGRQLAERARTLPANRPTAAHCAHARAQCGCCPCASPMRVGRACTHPPTHTTLAGVPVLAAAPGVRSSDQCAAVRVLQHADSSSSTHAGMRQRPPLPGNHRHLQQQMCVPHVPAARRHCNGYTHCVGCVCALGHIMCARRYMQQPFPAHYATVCCHVRMFYTCKATA
jgi:hypothetical protein